MHNRRYVFNNIRTGIQTLLALPRGAVLAQPRQEAKPLAVIRRNLPSRPLLKRIPNYKWMPYFLLIRMAFWSFSAHPVRSSSLLVPLVKAEYNLDTYYM